MDVTTRDRVAVFRYFVCSIHQASQVLQSEHFPVLHLPLWHPVRNLSETGSTSVSTWLDSWDYVWDIMSVSGIHEHDIPTIVCQYCHDFNEGQAFIDFWTWQSPHLAYLNLFKRCVPAHIKRDLWRAQFFELVFVELISSYSSLKLFFVTTAHHHSRTSEWFSDWPYSTSTAAWLPKAMICTSNTRKNTVAIPITFFYTRCTYLNRKPFGSPCYKGEAGVRMVPNLVHS